MTRFLIGFTMFKQQFTSVWHCKMYLKLLALCGMDVDLTAMELALFMIDVALWVIDVALRVIDLALCDG